MFGRKRRRSGMKVKCIRSPCPSNGYRTLPNGNVMVGSGLFSAIKRGFKKAYRVAKKVGKPSKVLDIAATITGDQRLKKAASVAKKLGAGESVQGMGPKGMRYVKVRGGYVLGGGLWSRVKKGFKALNSFARKHKLTSRGLTWLAAHTKNPNLLIAAKAARTLGYGSCKCR